MIKLFYVDYEGRNNPKIIHHICEWADIKCIHQDDLPMYLKAPTACCCSAYIYINVCPRCGYEGPLFEYDWNNSKKRKEIEKVYWE